MIIINPIPGQEEENAQFLQNQGVGVWIKKDDNSKKILERIINDDEKLKQMSEATLKFAKRNSTHDICKILFTEFNK